MKKQISVILVLMFLLFASASVSALPFWMKGKSTPKIIHFATGNGFAFLENVKGEGKAKLAGTGRVTIHTDGTGLIKVWGTDNIQIINSDPEVAPEIRKYGSVTFVKAKGIVIIDGLNKHIVVKCYDVQEIRAQGKGFVKAYGPNWKLKTSKNQSF